MSTCAEYFTKSIKNRRRKIIITCEPEDVKLIEDAIDKIAYDKTQGTIQIKYEPAISVKEK